MHVTIRDEVDSTSRPMKRAKRACRECHIRRVRCDVIDIQPCSSCKVTGSKCEVFPSRRGRYSRKPRPPPAPTQVLGSIGSPLKDLPDSSVNQNYASPFFSQDSEPSALPRSYSSILEGSSVFVGESNLFTCINEEHSDEGANTEKNTSHRLCYNLSSESHNQNTHITSTLLHHDESSRVQYLHQHGALSFPRPSTYLPAIRAYFTWFHPCYPIVNRKEFSSRVMKMEVSPLLLQAMLFIGAIYCDEDTISLMGFSNRSEAKCMLYTRAKLLFDADFRGNYVSTLQALFLMSFWKGSKTTGHDVRYWLGVAISLAQSYGLHRSTRFITHNHGIALMRRRIWWSIYVREQLSAASLGLPRRIRDEDCDVEPLTPSDLEEDSDESIADLFGSCKSEHVVYVIKMVQIARLLGKIMDRQFAPGRNPTSTKSLKDLKLELREWKEDLSDIMRKREDEDNISIWGCLLHLGYNHLQILIHRDGFMRNRGIMDDEDKEAATAAACQISRIAEDMLSQQIIQFGQSHIITSLFSALCIHVITIRSTQGVYKKLAENRAQVCLLGLKEIQKYWKVNNLVLDFFFQYLDESTAKVLSSGNTETPQETVVGNDFVEPNSVSEQYSRSQIPITPSEPISDRTGGSIEHLSEEQYWDFVLPNWQGNSGDSDSGSVWNAQLHTNFDFLEKCL